MTTPQFAALAAAWRPEVVCHLAAQISVRASVADPVLDARVNVLGTLNVLEAARACGTRKVVFTSSVAVYGVPAALPVPADAGFDPRSPYAASKICGETYLRTYRALHGLDFTTLTLANVYGPRQRADGESEGAGILADEPPRAVPTGVFRDGARPPNATYLRAPVGPLPPPPPP